MWSWYPQNAWQERSPPATTDTPGGRKTKYTVFGPTAGKVVLPDNCCCSISRMVVSVTLGSGSGAVTVAVPTQRPRPILYGGASYSPSWSRYGLATMNRKNSLSVVITFC